MPSTPSLSSRPSTTPSWRSTSSPCSAWAGAYAASCGPAPTSSSPAARSRPGSPARVHLRQSGRPGSDWHGRVRRQVRHRDQPLLLDRRDPRDGVRRPVHDAVLLRLAGPLRARVPPAPIRREDPDPERGLLRGDDGLLLRASRCMPWASCSICCSGWSFDVSILVSAVIVLAYVLLGGLTSAIYNEVLQFFLIVFGFAPLVCARPPRGGRMGGPQRAAGRGRGRARAAGRRLHLTPGPTWAIRAAQSGRGRVVRPGDGARIRAVVRLLVHRLPGGAARHGGGLDDRRTAHSADRGSAQDAVPLSRDPSGHDRAGARWRDDAAAAAGPDPGEAGRRRSAAARRRGPRGARLRPRDADDAGAALPLGHARARAHGAAGLVHVGHGGERHGVQHRVDLRHLSEPHPARRVGRALSLDGTGRHRGRRSCWRSARPTSPARSTTSWICCSWSSRS